MKNIFKKNNIAEQIYKIINETVTNPNDPKQYDVASKKIRELIEKTPMPKDIETAIRTAYKDLNQRLELKRYFCCGSIKRDSRRFA